MGGEHFSHQGGGVNYLCLPHNPKYDRYKDDNQESGYVFGTEYDVSSTVGIFSDEIFMITRRLALSALSSHVVQCWWCPHEMTVHLDGPRSIMGTWWPHITTTRTKKTSFVLTKTRSMFQGLMRTRMVPYYSSWKGSVAHFRVFRMFSIESWHVLFAPSNKTSHGQLVIMAWIKKQNWRRKWKSILSQFVSLLQKLSSLPGRRH